jgi:hypothetical protein
MVSGDLTETAMDHRMLPSAKESNAEYMTLSRGRDESAQPRAQIAENSVNDTE